MFISTLPWPPPYVITKLKRARHVNLKITLQKGLEFVVPTRFNKKEIPKLLKINKAWIQKQLGELYQEFREIKTSPLPKKIALSAVGQLWKVNYIATNDDITLTANPKQKLLTVEGNSKDKWECKRILNVWTKTQAKKLLIAKLKKLSQKTGLKFKDAVIRNQTSRWASCSPKKRISLNYKLIFLPAALCQHLFIHELCHTVHLNHSKKFWNLVAKHDPLWKKRNDALRDSEKIIPPWSRGF